MKITISQPFLFILLFLNNAFAQNVTVSFKHEIINNKMSYSDANSSSNKLLTEDNEFAFIQMATKNEKEIILAKFKKSSGQQIWQKKLPVAAISKNPISRFIGIEKTDNGFSIFSSRYDSKAKEFQLIGQKFDENLNILDNPIILSTNKNRNKENPMFILYYMVKRNNHILFYDRNVMDYGEGEKDVEIAFTLVHKDLSVIWSKSLPIIKDIGFSIKAAGFDNNGNMSLLVDAFTIKNKGNVTYKTSQYLALKYDHKAEKAETIEILWNNQFKYFDTPTFKLDAEHNLLLITGVYHRTLPLKGTEGVFHLAFDYISMKTSYINLTPYTKDMITQFIGAKDANKGLLPPYLTVLSSETDSLGNSVFVLNDMSRAIAIILSTDNKGVILWSHIVPINSRDILPRYLDIKVLTIASNTYLLFNASKKSAMAPEKTNGYTSPIDVESALVILGYQNASGNLAVSTYSSCAENQTRLCNLNTIAKITDSLYSLNFDEMNYLQEIKSSVPAILEIN